MKTIKRLAIENAFYGDAGQNVSAGGNCRKAAEFARKHGLRFGNGVLFVVEDREEELTELLAGKGLRSKFDGFIIEQLVDEDFFEGAIIERYKLLSRVKSSWNSEVWDCDEITPRPGWKRKRRDLRIRFSKDWSNGHGKAFGE